MNKAVMKSVSPKLCEKIVNGECTMLLSKTKPKIDTPFKCYIYMTMNGLSSMISVKTKQGFVIKDTYEVYPTMANGRVILEFICDKIEELHEWQLQPSGKFQEYENEYLENVLKSTCLKYSEICNYKSSPYYKPLFLLHISQLKIYDKPKDLSEFSIMKKCNACKSGYESNACIYDSDCKVPTPLTRPPQSWGYVEELEQEVHNAE